MKTPFIFILSVALLLSCNRRDRCETSITYNHIPKVVLTYFPYNKGQTITFNKYKDSTLISEIIFSVDSISLVKEGKYTAGFESCPKIDTTEFFYCHLNNLTEGSNDISILIEGSTHDYHSELDINYFDQSTFKGYQFSEYVITGKVQVAASIIKNYSPNTFNFGDVYCIYPLYSARVYFNNKYGIVEFANDDLNERLILVP